MFLGAASPFAQAPVASGSAQNYSSDLGFSYSLPADWVATRGPATLPQAQQQAAQNATSDEEKQAVQCVQLPLTARHGTPPSVIVEVALPFECFKQQMTASDLPGFANGASEGLRRSFNLGEPTIGAYSLGSHSFWIERAKGTPKAQPYLPPYTVEIACTLLQKAAVCWMTMAADENELSTFEHGGVSLEGEPATALVPATAFAKKPS